MKKLKWAFVVTMKKIETFCDSVRNIRHFSLSDRVTIQVISVLCVISTLTTLLTFFIVFSEDQSWEDLTDYVLHWMTDNNINVNVSIFGCLNRIMNQQILHFTCELQLKYTLHSNSNKPQELTVINGQSSQLSKSYSSSKPFPWSHQLTGKFGNLISFFQATRKVVSVLRWISGHSSLMNSIFILLTLLYCIFSIMLYFGSKPHKPRLRLPWLISHMLVIILTTVIFICWTFITFFIDLLITIVCPVISGLVLGLSILLWRLIYTIHTNYRDGDDLEMRSRIKTRWSESDRDSGKLTEMSWQREGSCHSVMWPAGVRWLGSVCLTGQGDENTILTTGLHQLSNQTESFRVNINSDDQSMTSPWTKLKWTNPELHSTRHSNNIICQTWALYHLVRIIKKK